MSPYCNLGSLAINPLASAFLQQIDGCYWFLLYSVKELSISEYLEKSEIVCLCMV